MLLDLLDLLETEKDDLVRLVPVIGASALLFYFLIYPLYLHPLAKVPGPKICALTGWYIKNKEKHHQRNRFVEGLHEKYGSIVRIGPDEVDISDSQYLKDIYVQDMDKGWFYAQFVNYGSNNTFSSLDKQEHKDSRKASARFYSKSHVCSEEVQTNVRGVMSKLLKVMDESKNTSINVFILWSEMAMDAVTIFSYGSKYYESILDDPWGKGQHLVTEFLGSAPSWSVWLWYKTRPYTWFHNTFPWLESFIIPSTTSFTRGWIAKQFEASLKGIDEPGEQSLVNTLMGGRKNIFDATRTKSECFDHIAAGHNTTATTLSYLYMELARHPEVQNKLIAELKEFNGGKILDADNYESQIYSKVEMLPYMNAVINETLRVYAAIPGQEPRLAPKAGMLFRGTKQCPQCVIPHNTVITMQPYSVHRNAAVFPDPYSWTPERWMTKDEGQLKVMNKNMIPFSAGARMCIGLNLAQSEIRLNISSIMSRYRVKLQEGFDYDKDAYLTDDYTSIPVHANMPLIFEPLK